MRKLKLIWDFRGPEGAKTAEHHAVHLREYAAMEKLPQLPIGHELLSDSHTIAFMVVEEADMKPVRDALKPHRGQVYSE